MAATIGGGGVSGYHNRVTDNYGTVGGGAQNTAGDFTGALDSADSATVAGGRSNSAADDYAAVGGGRGNDAYGHSSTVVGGSYNVASGPAATVLGGLSAHAPLHGQIAHAGGTFDAFGTPGTAHGSFFVLRGTTDGAETAELYLDGAQGRLTLEVDRVMAFDILVVARSSPASDAYSAAYAFQGVIDNYDGSTLFIGTPVKTVLGEDLSVTAWDANVKSDDPSGTLSIHVTGSSDQDVRWVATVRAAEVAWDTAAVARYKRGNGDARRNTQACLTRHSGPGGCSSSTDRWHSRGLRSDRRWLRPDLVDG